jgi:hypothetical protein
MLCRMGRSTKLRQRLSTCRRRFRALLDFCKSNFDFSYDTLEHEAEWFRGGKTPSWELRLEVAEIADVILNIDWCRSNRRREHRRGAGTDRDTSPCEAFRYLPRRTFL